MYRVELISMPFAATDRPSFALTQIQSILKIKYPELFDVHIRYINHDFAEYIGLEQYNTALDGTNIHTGLEMDGTTTGIKEWMFRQIVFLDSADNKEEFLEFLSYVSKPVKNYVLELRTRIDAWLISVIEKLDLATADMLAFTCVFDQRLPSFAMARKIKQINPKIVTVAGGPACDFPAAQTIAENITCMDYVLSGLGLVSFPRLLHSLFVKKSEEVNHISGVFTRTNSTLLRDRKDWYGEELDINVKLDLDYRSFFESLNRFDSGSISPMLFFETSRGCWWAEQKRCLFCDINGTETKYCVKDSRIALDELQRLFSHRDRCKLYWATDSVIPEIYLDQVFPYLGEEMQSIKIFYEVRADISLLHIQKMAENHLCYVQAGIESLIGRTLKRLNKGVTPEGNLVFLRRCSQYGIHVLWNILVGLPSEQETDYSDYLPLIPKLFHLPPPSGIWSISYQRNSEYYCNQEKYGVKLISKNVPEKYLYPFPEQKISDLVYIYSNTQIGLIFRPKIIKYIQKIDWMIQKWKQRWLAGAPPFLFIRNHILFDSRQTEKETPLKPKEEEILHVLESPKNIYDICRETGLSYNRVQKYLYYLEQVLECIYFNPDTQCYVSLATEGRPILKKPLIPESFEEFMKAE